LVLAALGVTVPDRRRFVLWSAGSGFLFPADQPRSRHAFLQAVVDSHAVGEEDQGAGMVFYVVALVTAMFAGLGVERALKGEGKGDDALLSSARSWPCSAPRRVRPHRRNARRREGGRGRGDRSAILWGGDDGPAPAAAAVLGPAQSG